MGQMQCRKTEKDLKAEPFSVVLTAEDKKTTSRPTKRQSQTALKMFYGAMFELVGKDHLINDVKIPRKVQKSLKNILFFFATSGY